MLELSEKDFKITQTNILKDLVKKRGGGDNMHKQMGNSRREMEIFLKDMLNGKAKKNKKPWYQRRRIQQIQQAHQQPKQS